MGSGTTEETGTIGLRFLQNLDDEGEPIKETCGAGFHRNWDGPGEVVEYPSLGKLFGRWQCLEV